MTKYFVEIDGYRYPNESVITNFSENDYLDQYRDIKNFHQEYVGEELMNPFISYIDMKNKISYPSNRFKTSDRPYIPKKGYNCLKKIK